MIITLQDYNSLTNDTANDTLVTALIPAVNDAIELYCDRLFDLQDHTDWFAYNNSITLTQYPINKVKFIGYSQLVATFSNTTSYAYNITSTGITVQSDEDFTETEFLFSNYDTLAKLKVAIESSYASIILTIESGYEDLNYRLLRTGTGSTIYAAKRQDTLSRITGQRNLELLQTLQNSIYLPFNGIQEENPIMVMWNAGYATADMPKGLKLIMSNIIRDLVIMKVDIPKGGNIKSESMSLTNADYSYTLSDSSLIQKIINDNYASDLDFYRKITI
jgi:hypothetical protein